MIRKRVCEPVDNLLVPGPSPFFRFLPEIMSRADQHAHWSEQTGRARQQIGVNHVTMYHVGLPIAYDTREFHNCPGMGNPARHVQ